MDMLKVEKYEPENSFTSLMETVLSSMTVVLIVGGGVLTSVILFIFAKRQIMRFTLRSRRGPHVPVGHDAKKSIKKEIERRIDCIQQRIVYEPQLIHDDDSRYILKPDTVLPPYYYRFRAVDDIKTLEKEITKQDGSMRQPRDSLRGFLLTTLAAPMNGSGQRMIHQFCDMYEHARHDPSEFGIEEYETYRRFLMKLLDAARMLKSYSRKSSPNRTPVKKQTKVQSLLDPSRLRPPPPPQGGSGNVLSTNTRINYGLGVGMQQEQQPQRQNIVLQLDENEIMSIPPDSDVV